MDIKFTWLTQLVLIASLCLGAGCSNPEPGGSSALEAAAQSAREGEEKAAEAQTLLQTGQQVAAAVALMEEAQGLGVQAVLLYKDGNAENSADPAILVEYGDALKFTGDTDLAAKAYSAATEYAPSNPQYWLKLGKTRALLDSPDLKPILEALDQCIKNVQGGGDMSLIAEAHAARGDAYWRAQLYELAETAYVRSLAALSDHPPARLAMASIYARRGEVQKASSEIDSLGAIDRQTNMLLIQRMGEALTHMQRDRRTFVDTAENHLAYAKLLARVGPSPQILLALERSIELDDTNYVTWNLLGSLASQTGDTERARIAFTRSLELKPDQEFTKRTLDALPSN